MSNTPAACEVMAMEDTSEKLASVDNGGTAPTSGEINVQDIDVSRVEEDNGEASDETSSRRESNSSADGYETLETQETNNEDQDNPNNDLNLQDTTNTNRKRKKKRRSRRKSKSHSRTNSFTTPTPNPPTPAPPTPTLIITPAPTDNEPTPTGDPITPDSNPPPTTAHDNEQVTANPDTPPIPNHTETLNNDSTPQPPPSPPTNTSIDQLTPEEPTAGEPTETTDKGSNDTPTADTIITEITPINTGTNEITTATDTGNEPTDTGNKGSTETDTNTKTNEPTTTDTGNGSTNTSTNETTTTTNITDTKEPTSSNTTTSSELSNIDSGPRRNSFTRTNSAAASLTRTNSTITTSISAPSSPICDLAHLPPHLQDLSPPLTRGRSNAFYGNKLPPPLLHSHSDGAAIVAQHNTSASLSPRRNTVGLGVSVTPTIPEPAHSGLSKPKTFNYWRCLTPSQSQNLTGATPERAVLSHSKRFLVGFAETIGRRPSMEDYMVVHGAFRGRNHEDYFALFDGHGGKDAAAFAAEHLHQVLAEKLKTNNAVKSLKEAFADTNQMISDNKIIGGTTAVVALFIGKKGFIANVGDTRAVLCRDGVPVRVSLDHKPELPTESSRIKKLGGTVTTTYNSAGVATSRVNGMLSVSRALGDTPLQPYVSSDPEIHGPLNLDTESRNQFVVLACDGVWDVLTDEEATNIVAPIANPEIASRRLRDEAFARGSTDNISVMVIRCPPFAPCD